MAFGKGNDLNGDNHRRPGKYNTKANFPEKSEPIYKITQLYDF